jgi:hypothetical protein
MKTYKRNLGKLQTVAAMNCQTDTDCIDAKSEFEYTHGGKGDILMRMMSGRPLASITASKAFQISNFRDQERSTSLNR